MIPFKSTLSGAIRETGQGQHSEMIAVAVAVAVGVISATIWLVLYRLQQTAPGPKYWPIFGGLPELLRNYERMHDWLTDYFEKGLRSFTVRLPDGNIIFTADPAACGHILHTNFANYPKGERFHELMEELLGDGIFNTDGDSWKMQRSAASMEFASKVLRDYSSIVHRQYALTLAGFVTRASLAGNFLEMQDLFMRLTLDSICKVGFGVEVGTLSPELPDVPFARAFDEANRVTSHRFVDPLWKLKRKFNLAPESLLRKSSRYLDDFTYNVIRNRRAELEVGQATVTDDGKIKEHMKADLLSRFMLLDEEQNRTNLRREDMSDKVLRDVVLNFVLAGRDTTAATLSWFMYCLCTHPEVADKVYEEVCAFEKGQQHSGKDNRTCGGDLGSLDESQFSNRLEKFMGLLSYDAVVSNLQYLHAAITETIRLYPAVPQDAKGALADDALPDGVRVGKGDLVCYVPYAMGRLESLWGPDAKEYKPERWLKNGVFQPASPLKFTAFQAGPRICLGKDAAYLQMKIVMALLCRHFKFQLVPGHPVRYKMMIILSLASGIKVTATRRSS